MDPGSAEQTQAVAEQARAIGAIDTVIHNAGIYTGPQRVTTPEGHAETLAVKVLAPYLLTAWITGLSRLVYLSSDMHRSGDTSLRDLDWTDRRWNATQAYCDSKLYLTTLALAVANAHPDRCVNVVDPGWVPTRMGGPAAPDDLDLGWRTQVWLAVSDEPEAKTSGGYWHHHRRQRPASPTLDETFQRALLAELAALTGIELR